MGAVRIIGQRHRRPRIGARHLIEGVVAVARPRSAGDGRFHGSAIVPRADVL